VKIWLEQRRQIICIINHQEARSHQQATQTEGGDFFGAPSKKKRSRKDLVE
jgi:hypothetical protein